MKLSKDVFGKMIMPFAVVSALTGNVANAANVPGTVSEEVVQEAYEQSYKALRPMEEAVKRAEDKIQHNQADKEILAYLNDLYEQINSFSDTFTQPENLVAAYESMVEGGKQLYNFIFKGGEIKGYTFQDLSESGKQQVTDGFKEIDEYINSLVPGYKEGIRNWTVDKGADAVELWNQVQEWYEEYKGDVMEEYNARAQNASNIIKKK